MKVAASIIGALVVGALAFYLTTCRCERLPGLWPLGYEPSGPVNDWCFANGRGTARLCQIQIDKWRPRSVNSALP